MLERWDASPDLARSGVGQLLHGLLDYVVDGHFDAVQILDDAVESLEDQLFDGAPQGLNAQLRSFELRKSLGQLRRVVMPMRDVVNTLMRRDLHVVGDDLMPYYQDVYDHVLRAAREHGILADQLQYALDYRVVIERAVGYLMGAHRLDAVTAFDVLRRQARDSRRRVADVATEVLGETTGPASDQRVSELRASGLGLTGLSRPDGSPGGWLAPGVNHQLFGPVAARRHAGPLTSQNWPGLRERAGHGRFRQFRRVSADRTQEVTICGMSILRAGWSARRSRR